MQLQQVNVEKKLAFTIVEHPLWGMIIDACAVKVGKNKTFFYEAKKITKNNLTHWFDEVGEAKSQIINIIDNYSDDNISKRFVKTNERSIDFFKRIEKSFVEKHIRPIIDKSLSEIVDILVKNNIDLFFQGSPGSLINEQPVKIFKNPVSPVFNFERSNNKTYYHLTLSTEDQNISLTNQDAKVLSNNPCLLLIKNRLYRFEKNFDSKKLIPFFDKEYIVIPAKHEKSYYESFVKNAIKHYNVEAQGFKIEEINNEPVPYLGLEYDWNNRAVISISFCYDNNDTFFTPSNNELCRLILTEVDNNYLFQKISRDPERENHFLNILLDLDLVKLNKSIYTLPGNKIPEDHDQILHQRYSMLDWLSKNKELLLSRGFKIKQDHFDEKYFIGKPELKLHVSEKTDWFDLKGYVHFGKHKIPFIALKNNILKGKREYLLPDGTIGVIPDEWFEKYNDVMTFTTKNEDQLSLKKYHFTILENLDLVKKPPQLTKGVPFKNESLPKSLTATLRPYQKAGFQWLCFLQKNKLGGCLADDMGLGKTLQALTALLKLKESGSKNNNTFEVHHKTADNDLSYSFSNPMQLDLFADMSGQNKQKSHTSIIITPLSLIHNWINEIEKFAPTLKFFQHTGISRPQSISSFSRYDLILTTYGTVRSDISLLKEFNFSYIILDESQVIKNAGSKIFMAVKQLKGEYRLVLTGTPIENSLKDLWSQFSFLNPGMLGSLNNFKKEFAAPIENKSNSLKSVQLQKLIQPFILRRNKNQVAKELPDLTEKVHYCEMTDDQKALYERKKSEARNIILENYRTIGNNKARFLLLSSLTKLRLIANHPVIVENDYDKDSGKFQEVLHNINKVLSEDHKVLLFSQFVKHLNLFADHFTANNTPFCMLTGKIREKDREPIIKRFQNDKDMRVFLISMRAGGIGLNLTGADYVFMLDPWWNPAVEAQAINRAHRIGQDKKVFVYKFITLSSVEEKIIALQKHKAELSGMFINQNNPLKSLQIDELLQLF